MRIRTFAASVAIATVAAFPLAGAASAQPVADRDCPNFASQAEAQEALDSQAGDPERLDQDDDGVAFENQDYGSAAPADEDGADETTAPAEPAEDDQVSVVPRGGVDTGDGSGGQDPALLVLGGAAALGLAAAAGHRVARRSH